VRRKPPDSLDAWELYQRGLWHLYKRGAEDNDRAREFFRDAIAHDPDFALPYAGLAEACYSEIFHGFCDDPKSRLKEGLEAGERAASLDDREGATHYGLGRMLVIANESERAIACLEKSVDRNPSFAHGYFGLGAALCWFGRPAEGIEHLDLAMRLSPCDPLLWAMQSYRATCCNSLEQFELAEEWSKRSRNLRYNNIYAHINLIVALEGQGRVNETLEAVKSLLNLRHDFRVSELRELWKNFNVRDLKCYQKALCRAGLPE
jgi:tetratricopeptide (TPR) repeat protein